LRRAPASSLLDKGLWLSFTRAPCLSQCMLHQSKEHRRTAVPTGPVLPVFAIIHSSVLSPTPPPISCVSPAAAAWLEEDTKGCMVVRYAAAAQLLLLLLLLLLLTAAC
jgi:hypothetical protein